MDDIKSASGNPENYLDLATENTTHSSQINSPASSYSAVPISTSQPGSKPNLFEPKNHRPSDPTSRIDSKYSSVRYTGAGNESVVAWVNQKLTMDGRMTDDVEYVGFKAEHGVSWTLAFLEPDIEQAFMSFSVARTLRLWRICIISSILTIIAFTIYPLVANPRTSEIWKEKYRDKDISVQEMKNNMSQFCPKGYDYQF
jgi:hypothetical protein